MGGFMLTTDRFIATKGLIHIEEKNNIVNIKNSQENILIAHPEESTAVFESGADAYADQATFFLDSYKELAGDTDQKLVTISCKIDKKNYFLYVENNSVILKEGELQEEIPSEISRAIFYERSYLENDIKYATYESSVKSGFCLAVGEDGRNLMLKPCSKDEFDKTTKTTVFLLDFIFSSIVFSSDIKKPIPYRFQNVHNELLVAHPEESVATYEPAGQAKAEEATFYVNVYRELASNKGSPVAITHEAGGKNYLLCVASDSVILKESELPKDILSKTSELIFYVKEFSDGQSSHCFEPSMKLESSDKPGHYLAWSIEDSKKKLVLKPYHEGDIDETISIVLRSQNEEPNAACNL